MFPKAPVKRFTSTNLFVPLRAFPACSIGAFPTTGKDNLLPSYTAGGNSCVSKRGLRQNYGRGPRRVVPSTAGCEDGVIWGLVLLLAPVGCHFSCLLNANVKGEGTLPVEYGVEPGWHCLAIHLDLPWRLSRHPQGFLLTAGCRVNPPLEVDLGNADFSAHLRSASGTHATVADDDVLASPRISDQAPVTPTQQG